MKNNISSSLVVETLSISFSVISLCSSSLTILLIASMHRWNGFLAILSGMSCCQMIYDIMFPICFNLRNAGTGIQEGLEGIKMFGALSVSLWTNILSCIVLVVVLRLEYVDVQKNFILFCCIAFTPGLLFGIVNLYFAGTFIDVWVDQVYYWLRIASIALNFVLSGLIFYQAHQIVASSAGKLRSSSDEAILVLTRRMIYYPIVQTFSRVGVALYESLYGFHGFPEQADSMQYICACVAAVLTPSAGVGYFLVFIAFQPQAATKLIEIVNCVCGSTKQNFNPHKVEKANLAGKGYGYGLPEKRFCDRSPVHPLSQEVSDHSLLEPVYNYSEGLEEDIDSRFGLDPDGSAAANISSFGHDAAGATKPLISPLAPSLLSSHDSTDPRSTWNSVLRLDHLDEDELMHAIVGTGIQET